MPMALLFGVEQPCTRACPRHPIHGLDHGCGGPMPEEVSWHNPDISRFRNDFARLRLFCERPMPLLSGSREER